MAAMTVDECDDAIAKARASEGKAYYSECQRLVREIAEASSQPGHGHSHDLRTPQGTGRAFLRCRGAIKAGQRASKAGHAVRQSRTTHSRRILSVAKDAPRMRAPPFVVG